MYRLFVESIKNYFEMNKGEMSTRLLRAEPLLLLTDIRSFEEKKEKTAAATFRLSVFSIGSVHIEKNQVLWGLWHGSLPVPDILWAVQTV